MVMDHNSYGCNGHCFAGLRLQRLDLEDAVVLNFAVSAVLGIPRRRANYENRPAVKMNQHPL